MINFIICEDNSKQREIIKNCIENRPTKSEIKTNISLCTNNPHEVLKYVNDNYNKQNAYFLDVDLNTPDMNGLTLAKKIREKDSNCYIIFITAHPELSMMTFEYKIMALDYITKDTVSRLRQKLNECITIICNNYSQNLNLGIDEKSYINIKSGCRNFNVLFKNILFFETSDEHKIKVHTINDQIEFYNTFKNLMEELDSNIFYRCHKSYIINIKHIKEINKKDKYIVTTNNEKCFVSRLLMKGLMEKWKK